LLGHAKIWVEQVVERRADTLERIAHPIRDSPELISQGSASAAF